MLCFLLGLIIGCSLKGDSKKSRPVNRKPTFTYAIDATLSGALFGGFMKGRLWAEERKKGRVVA
jgi:hypothetical protein